MPPCWSLPVLLVLCSLTLSFASSSLNSISNSLIFFQAPSADSSELGVSQKLRSARHQTRTDTLEHRRLLHNAATAADEIRPGKVQGSENLVKPLSSVCVGKKNGTPLQDVHVCPVRVSHADAIAPLLQGGLDGVYTPVACIHGRPSYLRQQSPSGASRVLWWSARFGDWNLMNGTKAAQPSLDPLMYGGSSAEPRPQHVRQWHLATEFQIGSIAKGTVKLDYKPVNVTVACDGRDEEVPTTGMLQANTGSPISAQAVANVQQQQKEEEEADKTGQQSSALANKTPTSGQQQQQLEGEEGGQPRGDAGSREGKGAGVSQDERDSKAASGRGEQEGVDPAANNVVESGSGGAGGEGVAELLGGLEDATRGQLQNDWGQGEGLGDAARELKEPPQAEGAGVGRGQGLQRMAPLLWVRARAFKEQRSTGAILSGLLVLGAMTIAVGWPLVMVQRRRSRAAMASSPEPGVSVYVSLDPQGGRSRRKIRV